MLYVIMCIHMYNIHMLNELLIFLSTCTSCNFSVLLGVDRQRMGVKSNSTFVCVQNINK